MYAASQPLSQARANVADGRIGSSSVPSSAIPSSGPIASVTSAFASNAYTWMEPNWSQRIGAVATPQAIEIASASRSQRGIG